MRAFYYYLYKKILIGLVFLVVSIIVLSSQTSISQGLSSVLPASAANTIVGYLTSSLFIISFLALAIGVFLSWLNYISCTFILGDLSFVIKRGILSKKIETIPYKQIQDITIEQSFSSRLMGVCKLVILTAGNDNNDKEKESEGVFGVIDINIAKNLQSTILQKNK
jgi:uncharacterized membrane protein YdbT with pleckstrin-like domain